MIKKSALLRSYGLPEFTAIDDGAAPHRQGLEAAVAAVIWLVAAIDGAAPIAAAAISWAAGFASAVSSIGEWPLPFQASFPILCQFRSRHP